MKLWPPNWESHWREGAGEMTVRRIVATGLIDSEMPNPDLLDLVRRELVYTAEMNGVTIEDLDVSVEDAEVPA